MGRRRLLRLRILGGALGLALVAGALFRLADPGAPAGGTDGHAAGGGGSPPPRALPAGRDDFAAAFRAGLRNLQAGEAHAAARAFGKAVALRPHEPQARINLGFSYLALGRAAEALELFAAASGIAPMAANAYYGMAQAHEALGEIEAATGAMRTFVHLAGEDDPFRRRAMAALWEWEQTRPPPEEAGQNAAAPDPAGAAPPAPAPTGVALLDAPLETLEGAPARLADHRGRLLVLNIWASWCGPCRAELPSLARLARSLDPARAEVLGVSMDRNRLATSEYLRELGLDLPSYRDGAGGLTRDILAVRTIPLTLIVSPSGEILTGYEGARDWSEPGLAAAIAALAAASGPGTEPPADRLDHLVEVLR